MLALCKSRLWTGTHKTMSTHTNENDPAFPSDAACPSWQCRKPSAGISAREHAAIHLRVPMSGNAWLDAMITEARRWDAAIAALPTYADHNEFTRQMKGGAQ